MTRVTNSCMSASGDRRDVYRLHHYNYGVLSWALPYEELLEHQLWPIADAGYYLLEFESSKGEGDLDRIVWKCSWGSLGGEIYERGG